MKLTGRVSWFGGPNDQGVSSSEDLAFWEDITQVARREELFLPNQPSGTTGLARRLDADHKFYIATRWDYDEYPKSELKTWGHVVKVFAPKTGKTVMCRPADWGPNEQTNRIADVSYATLEQLGIETDDTVEVEYPWMEPPAMPTFTRIAISAGHGEHVTGAEGVGEYEEQEETPVIMEAVAEELAARGCAVMTFWDQKSTTQQQNLDAIVSWHNKQTRDLDVSIHLNASNGSGHGVEVLYVTQEELADKIAAAVSKATGLTNRGAKYNGSLAFLNGTNKPAVLCECFFIDNSSDIHIYETKFAELCNAIATGITGIDPVPIEPPVEPPVEIPPVVEVALSIPDGVGIVVTINGETVFSQEDE